MKSGCILALFLLPITLVIWVEKERRRRAAMPPEERKALEDEEQFGEINPDIECIYCHNKNCVRSMRTVHLREGYFTETIHPDHPILHA